MSVNLMQTGTKTSMQLCVHDPLTVTSNKETFIQGFLVGSRFSSRVKVL